MSFSIRRPSAAPWPPAFGCSGSPSYSPSSGGPDIDEHHAAFDVTLRRRRTSTGTINYHDGGGTVTEIHEKIPTLTSIPTIAITGASGSTGTEMELGRRQHGDRFRDAGGDQRQRHRRQQRREQRRGGRGSGPVRA